MAKPYYPQPPDELRGVLGERGYDYLSRIHEAVHGYGPNGKGNLDANNLEITEEGEVTPSGKQPVLVADPTTGKLKSTTATVPVEDITATQDGIVVGKTTGGKVASTEEASPYINHRQTSDYVDEEHKPLDDEVEYDPLGTPEEISKAENTVWSAKKIQEKLDALSGGGGGAGTITLSGDVTGSGTLGGTTTTTIDDGVVTLPKMADVATGTVFYRKTAGTGSPEVQSLATLAADLGISGAGGNVSRVVKLAGGTFNGVLTSFTGLLPSEPDVVNNVVVLLHSGIGPLEMISGVPAAGQFDLGGATNQDVTFGYPPAAGDVVHAIYVEA